MTDQPTPAAILAGAPVLPPGAQPWDPTTNVYDAARHVLALASEPDALDRIRAVLFAIHDNATEEGREEVRETIRMVADKRRTLSSERAAIGTKYLPHDPARAAGEIQWAATLLDQANALRSILP